MAHLQYMPGDPRLVDQLVYELKSKGIFDQFRKDCISDVDTRPAYQNLRQRVESSVTMFLSRQTWMPDLNKNQLREKLRKHILDGNYLEQGVERIVDQVVNPKVASVFIPQVEDLVYNYLGITRKKSIPTAETSNDKGNSSTDLLPTDLEAVSPGSVKSNDDKDDAMDIDGKVEDMDVDEKSKDHKEDSLITSDYGEQEKDANDSQLSGISDLTSHDSDTSLGKLSIPMPAEEINLENIPSPENSPPKIDLDSIELPKEEPIELKDIPLPDESPKDEKDPYFKPVNSEDDSSSDSSLIRNMSPLTPIRNFNNENSCDAQQAFENDSDNKSDDKKEPNTFRFTIESKSEENSVDNKDVKSEKEEQTDLSYQFNNQVNINTFNTPLYDDSSNSHNLQIDYESDANSKNNLDKIPFPDDPNSEDSKKETTDEKRKSSHKSRDSDRHRSKDRRNDSKSSSSKDRRDSKHSSDKKSSKDESKSKSSNSEKSKDRSDRKDSKDSKHRSSHKSSSSSKDSKHRSSSSSQKHSSKHDDRKSSSSSSSKDKEKEKNSDKNKEHRSSRDSKSRSDKDRKSSKRQDDKEKEKEKKDKKDIDDHYSASGRGNHTRRSTDRDSNDGSSSSKGSHNQSSSKSSESKNNKGGSSKSDNTSPSSDSTSPSDKEHVVADSANISHQQQPQQKPIVRVENHLETPVTVPPRLPFVPDVTLKKPKFAANMQEAKRLMKMRKFLDEEQKRMNQEAALLLEFQANVRPSLSQVYSSIPGPELEFACMNTSETSNPIIETNYAEVKQMEQIGDVTDDIEMKLTEMNKEEKVTEVEFVPIEYKHIEFQNSEDILDQISKKVYGVDCVDNNDVENMENNKSDFKEDKPATEIHTTDETKETDNKFEITIVTEDENEIIKKNGTNIPKNEKEELNFKESPLKYFAEHEKYDAELERDKFDRFLKNYTQNLTKDRLHLINCDAYEESIVREAAEAFGQYEIVNYHKNGHINKNIVKDVNLSTEINLPLDRNTPKVPENVAISPFLSPVKSECSFELSSDYDAKLEEMVNKTSRQEIMEIILGGSVPSASPSKMPQIDYCMEVNIEENDHLKRKIVDNSDNNNRRVLTPTKMRKLSGSDQITSTTEETPENKVSSVRSKYLGKARRVGLPKPKRPVHPNSPSSDKSVENYEQNTNEDVTPNGKLKVTRKVQRYDTSDLYKPKLHYLSRRNNIT